MENFGEKMRSPENFGANIKLTIDLIRHAEKDGINGGLTEEGKERAREFGLDENIKAYHSRMSENPRTQQTAEAISDSSKYHPRERKGLGIEGDFSPEFIDRYIALVNESGGNESKAVQMFLDTYDERPDEKTISSKDVSKQLVSELLHFVEMTKRFKSGSDSHVALVSHTGVIEHLLVDLFQKDRKDFITEIGGSMKFLEGPKIEVLRENKDNVKIVINFRGQEVELSEDYLRDLAGEYKE